MLDLAFVRQIALLLGTYTAYMMWFGNCYFTYVSRVRHWLPTSTL